MPPGGPLTLGLDIGTQGAKAIVYDPRSKKVVARGKGRVGDRGGSSPRRCLERKTRAHGRAAPVLFARKEGFRLPARRPTPPGRPATPALCSRPTKIGSVEPAWEAHRREKSASGGGRARHSLLNPPHPRPSLHFFSLSPSSLPTGAKAYDLLPTTVPGRAEQHPATWLDGGFDAARQALAALPANLTPAHIGAVGVSGQQHGCVVLDSAGAPIRPAKLWCDTEAAPQADALSARWAGPGRKGGRGGSGGGPIVPAFTVAKVAWLMEHEPEALARAAAIMLPHDYINFVLTGGVGGDRPGGGGGLGATTDAGDASGSGLLDPTTRAYDPARLADPSLPPNLAALLPTILPPDACAGTLSAESAGRLGGLSPGIRVSAGTGDNMAAALGVGAVWPGASAVASLGTSGTLFAPSGVPVVDPTGAIAPFCDAAGQWLPLDVREVVEFGLDEGRR